MPTKIEKDSVTGVNTTGHEWDGIKELNNPLPRWWLYVFYACILFAIVYMVLYPSVPLGTTYFKGIEGYSQRVDVTKEIAAAKAAKGEYLTKIETSDLKTIESDPNLLEFSMAGGRAAFGENCAPCHGSGAQGGPGYPNLADDDWLWGGTLEDIHTTLENGIRWPGNDDTRYSEMPRFGADGILDQGQIVSVANYVLSLSGLKHDAAEAEKGSTIFAENCAACHGETGAGDRTMGAPALNDQKWLYGNKLTDVVQQVTAPRHGVMPAWGGRLDPATIKMLTVYVHTLGGGEN